MIPGNHSGQTLNDRLNAARYALAGQGLARVVCKATTEEMIAPKKKHIDYLLQCTDEPNVSIPQLANLLIERTQHSSWIVVFKALITVHHLMCYGNERFTQYLASSNCNFQLNNYLDKNAPKGYDMSIFIRRYARYINAKALSYRTVAFDFTKVKRGSEGELRQMSVEKMLKTIPVLQNQVDALLEFDCNATDLNNNVINAAFFLLFKDLIRLFACYNDGIITCLQKYFDLTNKKMARETLDIYKKFLIRMNKVGEFLKIAEIVGVDRGEIPDLTKAPSSLLDAMEQHLAHMEGRKPGTTSNGDKTEESVKKAIEEEERFLNKLKSESSETSEKHLQEKKINNPFLTLSSPSKTNENGQTSKTKNENKNKNQTNEMIDLISDTTVKEKKENNQDLFSLDTGSVVTTIAADNPFADILSSLNVPSSTNTVAATTSTEFTTSDGFAAAFGSSSNSNIGSTKKSPTEERQKSAKAPSRPPPPPSTTTKNGDDGEKTVPPSRPKPPSRPPAPTSTSQASTPSNQQQTLNSFPTGGETNDNTNPQFQQFLQFQQQMMQQMMQSGELSIKDPAQMMAQMQKMYAQMMSSGVMPATTATSTPNKNEPEKSKSEDNDKVAEELHEKLNIDSEQKKESNEDGEIVENVDEAN